MLQKTLNEKNYFTRKLRLLQQILPDSKVISSLPIEYRLLDEIVTDKEGNPDLKAMENIDQVASHFEKALHPKLIEDIITQALKRFDTSETHTGEEVVSLTGKYSDFISQTPDGKFFFSDVKDKTDKAYFCAPQVLGSRCSLYYNSDINEMLVVGMPFPTFLTREDETYRAVLGEIVADPSKYILLKCSTTPNTKEGELKINYQSNAENWHSVLHRKPHDTSPK